VTGSERREPRSGLVRESDAEGVLVFPKADARDSGDLNVVLVRSALVWPPCRCGSPKCPDYKPSSENVDPAEPTLSGNPRTGLSKRVADLNERSRRGKP
jgi:hypothetical protein